MHKLLELYNQINRFGAHHNMTFTVEKPGVIEYRMRVLPEHMATPVAIHGGMISAMMDAVLGVAALSLACHDNRLVSTVEFKINFLHPAQEGDELVGNGRVDQKGKRIIISTGEIYCENRGKPIAKGMGTFNAYPVERSGILEKLAESGNE